MNDNEKTLGAEPKRRRTAPIYRSGLVLSIFFAGGGEANEMVRRREDFEKGFVTVSGRIVRKSGRSVSVCEVARILEYGLWASIWKRGRDINETYWILGFFRNFGAIQRVVWITG